MASVAALVSAMALPSLGIAPEQGTEPQAPPAAAAQSNTSKLMPKQDQPTAETIGSVRDIGRALVLGSSSEAQKSSFEAQTKKASDLALERVRSASSATSAPDGFASRMHSTYQDFLNLLSFAINSVDESKDGQSLIVRFNPFQEDQGADKVGLAATITKPSVYKAITDRLPNEGREAILAKMKEGLSDLDDVTFSLAYTRNTRKCTLESAERCYGRDPGTYRDLVSTMLVEVVEPDTHWRTEKQNTIGALMALLPEELQNKVKNNGLDFFKIEISSFVNNRERARELAMRIGEIEGRQTLGNSKFYSGLGFDVLEDLVDNQPQVALVFSYREPGRWVGPDEWTATLEVQGGKYNINKLRRDSKTSARTPPLELLQEYKKDEVGGSRFVFALTYSVRSAYKLEALEVNGTVVGLEPFELARSRELTAKGQWGTKLRQKIGDRRARVDFTLEGIRAFEDEIRTRDRWVASATITLPLGEAINVPVSVNWANKSEFLGEQKRRLSTHLGITYRIPVLGSEKD